VHKIHFKTYFGRFLVFFWEIFGYVMHFCDLMGIHVSTLNKVKKGKIGDLSSFDSLRLASL